MLLTLILGIISWLATRNLQIEPGPLQNMMEVIFEKLENFVCSMMGERGKEWLFLIGPLFIYILLSNVMGLVPQGESPTSNVNQTIALALFSFFFTQYAGLKSQGFNYFKHFMGDVWWLAPIFLIIHIIGELARPLSLSMRLFGNIRGEDITLCILFFLVPFIVPLPMIFLMAFTSLIQAMVFTMLTMSYIDGALPHEHH
jgi:F-type H+-transporting ATPase subunit a